MACTHACLILNPGLHGTILPERSGQQQQTHQCHGFVKAAGEEDGRLGRVPHHGLHFACVVRQRVLAGARHDVPHLDAAIGAAAGQHIAEVPVPRQAQHRVRVAALAQRPLLLLQLRHTQQKPEVENRVSEAMAKWSGRCMCTTPLHDFRHNSISHPNGLA